METVDSPFSQFDGLRPQGDGARPKVTTSDQLPTRRRRPLALQGILRGGELLTFHEGTPWTTARSE